MCIRDSLYLAKDNRRLLAPRLPSYWSSWTSGPAHTSSNVVPVIVLFYKLYKLFLTPIDVAFAFSFNCFIGIKNSFSCLAACCARWPCHHRQREIIHLVTTCAGELHGGQRVVSVWCLCYLSNPGKCRDLDSILGLQHSRCDCESQTKPRCQPASQDTVLL